jgi:hypothetical protein
MIDDETGRVICEGCITGQWWKCKSFPGKAEEMNQKPAKESKRKTQTPQTLEDKVFKRNR